MAARMRQLRMLAVVAVGAAVIAACAAPSPPNTGGGGVGTGEGEATEPVGDEFVRLNEIQLIGSHNSYKLAPDAAILQWLTFGAAAVPQVGTALGDPAQLNYEHQPLPAQLSNGIRTFELDIFADPQGGKFANPLLPQILNLGLPRPAGMDEPGMKVLHIQDIDYRSTCPTLVACLTQMRVWSDTQPDHLPIIVNVEMKDSPLPSPFDGTAIIPFDAAQLDAVDAEILSVLGDRLITPDDVRGPHSDLRTAITTDGWPTLADSRGRFLFFMDNADKRSIYLDGHPSLEGRVMFTSSGEGAPDGAVLKVNDPGDGSRIADLVSDGYLVRTRADADVVAPSVIQRDIALASGAQIVHSDFPPGRSMVGTGYVVSFGTRVAGRCNPVLTTVEQCAPPAVVESR
jgi:hypothetical protein